MKIPCRRRSLAATSGRTPAPRPPRRAPMMSGPAGSIPPAPRVGTQLPHRRLPPQGHLREARPAVRGERDRLRHRGFAAVLDRDAAPPRPDADDAELLHRQGIHSRKKETWRQPAHGCRGWLKKEPPSRASSTRPPNVLVLRRTAATLMSKRCANPCPSTSTASASPEPASSGSATPMLSPRPPQPLAAQARAGCRAVPLRRRSGPLAGRGVRECATSRRRHDADRGRGEEPHSRAPLASHHDHRASRRGVRSPVRLRRVGQRRPGHEFGPDGELAALAEGAAAVRRGRRARRVRVAAARDPVSFSASP